MIEKYKKYKKLIRSFLCIGTMSGVLGVFCIFTESIFISLLLIILGVCVLIITYNLKKKTIKIENNFKTSCINCNKSTSFSSETKYYVLNKLVSEEEFNQCDKEKTKMIFNYYKCIECHICMTIINSYLIINNNEKKLNDKINIDFSYEGNY